MLLKSDNVKISPRVQACTSSPRDVQDGSLAEALPKKEDKTRLGK